MAGKKKYHKAIYKQVKTGGTRRKTASVNKGKGVFKGSKKGKYRRVVRINPAIPAFAMDGLAVLAGGLAGVIARVLPHVAAPGNDTAQKAVAAIGFVGGLLLARKHAVLGASIATGCLDAGVQNTAVFKVETAIAPTVKGLRGMGSIKYDTMGALPSYASMRGTSDPYPLSMGQVVSENMRGFDENVNPFED